jgi:hypothetical protein
MQRRGKDHATGEETVTMAIPSASFDSLDASRRGPGPLGWTRDLLARRIDRCYLVAARTRIAAKRAAYLALARDYRRVWAELVLSA